MDLKKCVRSIVDWPIEGVIFRDLTTLMKDPLALKESCDILYERYRDQHIDKIVGIDARGFVFGAVLAYKLGLGFVPVRKKGKLPHDTIEEIYSLEYGAGVMEIHSDAISHGEKIVIVDDLIATGGTIGATVKLVEKLGGEIVECAFLIELPELKGREQITNCAIFSIMEFEGE
jgi:adenine phosphoribosyltransferase